MISADSNDSVECNANLTSLSANKRDVLLSAVFVRMIAFMNIQISENEAFRP